MVASTALYGALAFGVSLSLLDASFSAVTKSAGSGDLEGIFCAFMLISLVAYPVLMAIHIALVAAWRKNRGDSDSAIADVPSWVVADLTNPFRGLRALVGMRGGGVSLPAWVAQISHLVWSLALWAWIAAGLVLVAS
jgi:hypothetical protein